jgi:hypothetical protein
VSDGDEVASKAQAIMKVKGWTAVEVWDGARRVFPTTDLEGD